jgi:hypothetical protein
MARGPQLDFDKPTLGCGEWLACRLRVRWRRGRPLRINDLIMIDAEKGRDLCKVLGLDIASSD